MEEVYGYIEKLTDYRIEILVMIIIEDLSVLPNLKYQTY